MKQTNLLAITLIGLSRYCATSQALSVPYTGSLTRGQGFNTFLGEGAKHAAVEITSRDKRAAPPLAGKVHHEELQFPFVPPDVDLFGLDLESYFQPPDENEIDLVPDYASEDEDENAVETGDLRARGEEAAKPGGKPGDKPVEQPGAKPAPRPHPNCAGKLQVDTSLQTTYEKYLKALDISASATISGWGQSASLTGQYLDKSEFSSKSLIYLAKLEVTKQQDPDDQFKFNLADYHKETFNADFGNRWIRGFETGGKMIARVVFTVNESTSIQDIRTDAEASLNFWGSSVGITASMQKSMENLSKKTNIKVSMFYQGNLGNVQDNAGAPGTITSLTSVEEALREVKAWSDKFLENACTHTYKYRALLDKYPTVSNFPRGQKIANYLTAETVSFFVLKELARLAEMNQLLQNLDVLTEEVKGKIEDTYLRMVEASQEWIVDTAEAPGNARNTSKVLVKRFKTEYYDSYGRYVPGLPIPMGECGTQGGGKFCPGKRDCCSGTGKCGRSDLHCGYMDGIFCQSTYGSGACYFQTEKEGQSCESAIALNGFACAPGLCCNKDSKCTKQWSTDQRPGLGHCSLS